MAAGNQVTLTFVGDEKSLTKAMDNVGAAAKSTKDRVGETSKALDEHGNALGKLGEKADNSERSLIGVHDVIDGTATIMQGPGKQGIVAYIQGWADLAGGLAPLLLQLAETKVSVIANTAATAASAVASGVATAAQWAWNAALVVGAGAMAILTSPITLVILAIAALVAIVILIIKYHKQLGEVAVAAWNWIKGAAQDTWNWLKQVPGWIEGAFAKVASAISAPFRSAFNFVADAWNNTVGRLSWSVPSWVPGIGGNSIGVPHLPHFAMGGTVPGMAGAPVLAVVHGGETVTSRGSVGNGALRIVVDPAADSLFASMFHAAARAGLIQVELT